MDSEQGKAAPASGENFEEIERIAVELANLAGAEIVNTLGGILEVRYKGKQTDEAWRDPVSEADQHIEQLIRSRLAERFPEHDIIGEEFDARPGRDHDYVWAVDPIDGTANFVNGFPMFSAAIGVLHRGRPVVGALWCATGHALRAGVYHAREGGALMFDGDVVEPRHNPMVRRRLAGMPQQAPGKVPWEIRKTGSAAIECAFVAAGLLQAARFETPNLWDIAGGVALVRAAGGEALIRQGGSWRPLERFEPPEKKGREPDLRYWRQPLIIGRVDTDQLIEGLGHLGT